MASAASSAPGWTWTRVGVVFLLGAGAVLAVEAASAKDATAPCAAWDIEYTLAANVELSDTAFKAGDGVHKIGPGRLVLRVPTEGDRLSGRVRMLSYLMHDEFTVVAKTLFWATTVKNDTQTTATPDANGTIAEGSLEGRKLTWSTVLNGMHTDGSLNCDGSFCGKFGAPPEGPSDVHTAPHPVTFAPFEFDADQKTFTMAYSVVARSDTPSQTSRISLAGREARRTCAK
jgi:hypothetical protein